MNVNNFYENSKINCEFNRIFATFISINFILIRAINLRDYWINLINQVDCITEVFLWDWHIDDYYNRDSKALDKMCCKRGGFISYVSFNPMEFRMLPNILKITDVSQLLSLVVAKWAIEDAVHNKSENFNGFTSAIILGV
ncbi:beta-ketoacyl synthase N-terminal-like domain-containing protein [Trichocoleus sp. DQ-U1]|uniref:beta-ketoacyl synthase N-terminal-like domain-containing protein n=1 Tax=Trichocoleus sp. DQ-U1 TaxID=2933926 RepID=UPI00329855FB